MDEFLDQFTPDEFTELMASERLDPDPMERLCEILKIGFATILAGLGAEDITPEAFEPSRSEPAAKKSETLSPNDFARMVGLFVPIQRE